MPVPPASEIRPECSHTGSLESSPTRKMSSSYSFSQLCDLSDPGPNLGNVCLSVSPKCKCSSHEPPIAPPIRHLQEALLDCSLFLLYRVQFGCVHVCSGHLHLRTGSPGHPCWAGPSFSPLPCHFQPVEISALSLPSLQLLLLYLSPWRHSSTGARVPHTLAGIHVPAHLSLHSHTHTLHVCEHPHTQSSLGKLPSPLLLLLSTLSSHRHPPQNTGTKEVGWMVPPTTCQPGGALPPP